MTSISSVTRADLRAQSKSDVPWPTALIVWMVASTLAWIVVSVLLLKRTPSLLSGLTIGYPLVEKPSAFLLLSLAILTRSTSTSATRLRWCLAIIGALGIGAAFFTLIAVSRSHRSVAVPFVTGFSVFVAAAVEEIVFRDALPGRLTELIAHGHHSSRYTRFAAGLISQLAFGVCHVIPFRSHLEIGVIPEIIRITAGGLLYSAVVATTGLWLAIGVHASLNFVLLNSVEIVHHSATAYQIACIAAIGVCMLGNLGRMPRTRELVSCIPVPLDGDQHDPQPNE